MTFFVLSFLGIHGKEPWSSLRRLGYLLAVDRYCIGRAMLSSPGALNRVGITEASQNRHACYFIEILSLAASCGKACSEDVELKTLTATVLSGFNIWLRRILGVKSKCFPCLRSPLTLDPELPSVNQAAFLLCVRFVLYRACESTWLALNLVPY